MRGKLMLLAGAAVGYVLGTRAGRQRYEEIKGRADALWHDPKVQQRISDAEEKVKARAPQVSERLSGVASRAGDKVKSTVQRHPETEEGSDQAEVIPDGRPGTSTEPGR